MRRRLLGTHAFAIAASLVTLGAGLWVVQQFVTLENDRTEQLERNLVLHQVSAIRARLEGELNATLWATRGLTAYVATHPGITRDEFDPLAAEIIGETKHVRNIGLAPDNVIRYVYPLKGNEKAIGLHYLDNPAQRDAVSRAIEQGTTVVAGPVNLVQGGVAFINRTPIYTDNGRAPGGRRYWGLASVVVNERSLFAAADLDTRVEGVAYALRGKDGLGAQGAVFFGDPALFERDAVVQNVTLPAGSWQLAAAPIGGWNTARERTRLYFGVGLALSLLLAALVYGLLRERQRIRHLALHDSLTGLPNRLNFNLRLEHLLERATRQKSHFALLCLDLDDFKPVNDRYGHRAGDWVLQLTGQRLRQVLRRSDTLARVGGDEFMVLLEGNEACQQVCIVANKMIEQVTAPITVGDNQVRVSVSIGIAFYPDSGDTVDQLISRADQAMYRAKSAGKNRCVCDDVAMPITDAPVHCGGTGR